MNSKSLPGMRSLSFSISLLTIIILSLFMQSCQKIAYEEDPAVAAAGFNKKEKLKQGDIRDIDGNVYKTVKIGQQVWMTENLKVTRYNDGTAIPLIEDNAAWEDLTSAGYCFYNNDYNTYGKIYGALYNWWAVENSKICPEGWHVPSDAEWTTLINFTGGFASAGGKLKETGFKHWLSPNTGATDEFGFKALPAGARDGLGKFDFLGGDGHWWSSTSNYTYSAWLYYISHNWEGVARIEPMKYYGVSVRCIRD